MKNYNVKEILKSDQALAFSNYLKKLNNDLSFEIIFPKVLWPNIEKEQPDEAMHYINQHHKVFQDSTENDFGIDYILGASTSADCWIHIKNGKDEIVGYATNVFYKINSQKVNFFRVTFFKQSIRQLKIYPYLQDLRINIFPSDIYYLEKMPSEIKLGSILMVFILSIIITSIASYFPAKTISKLKSNEALKYE